MGVTEQIEDLWMDYYLKSSVIQNRVSFKLFVLNVAIQMLRFKRHDSNVIGEFDHHPARSTFVKSGLPNQLDHGHEFYP